MWKVWVISFLLIPLSISNLSTKAWIKHSGQAQETGFDSIHFDDVRLRQYKEDPDFDYSESVQESWWTRFKSYLRLQWNKFIIWLLGEVPSSSFLLFLVKALPYLILIGVLFFFLWLFHRMNPGKAFNERPNNSRVFTSEEEAIVESQNIDDLIEEALHEKDYKLAVRYQYLLVLQFLSRKSLINYQSDKTNADYAKEIDQKSLRRTFLDLSRIYDYTWYGNFDADQGKFHQMQTGYDELVNKSKASDEKK